MTENERIKQLRKSLKLTQDEFGDRVGIKKSSVSTMESGKSNPSAQTRHSICREFGVSEEWLRDGVGEMYRAEGRDAALEAELRRVLEDVESPFRERAIRLLLRMPREHWDLLEQFVRSLLDEEEPIETPEERAQKRASAFYEEALAEEKAADESSASPPTRGKKEA